MRIRTVHLRNQAFTLVEVLVVVAIIGVASMVVVPQILRSGDMQIQAAGRIVISDLLTAQNEAVARQSPRRVEFDQVNSRYRLTDAAGVTLVAPWRDTATYVTDFKSDTRFRNVRLAAVDFAGSNVVEFDDMGAPTIGGTVDLLTDSTRYRITVAPFTGRITIAQVVATETEGD
jgi:prepilin-type N-terminal cleavage/methylation domain-containing protein